ncbi:MAG: DUF3299 domain-containing protein [Gammaproteobacteria bacterium]|nr:DUF3299 domain-containing protein [Gammaproteobacteria bacterium]MBQ0839368.1 DUF3299 domain-containing protein [Gammaproteobacteria bacterium]
MTASFSEARGDDSIVSSVTADISSEVKPVDVNRVSNKTAEKYRTIEWPELMPEDDLGAIMNPPDFLDDIIDGSVEDQIGNQVQSAIAAAADNRYQQALESTRVVAEFNNQSVRIPGFIVPLELDGDQAITRFFLVPYFGACIHVPPPPPNQIIYASYPKGFKLKALYDPFWITGVLKTSLTENDTTTSAYSIVVDSIQPYMP